uniref:Uncharacterized protein n=1 Tax=Podoviridae sp. ctsNK10 TaxID=2826582 RepID=A0A8S5NLQ7_9CAUD|nr:MAG TPA: hypothetical protein [Podoviridae sp. ctsNK10]
MTHLANKYLQHHVLGRISILSHTFGCRYLPLMTLHILGL